MGSNLVPASRSGLVKGEALPAILDAAGKAARFAYQEFFYGEIRNPHTRLAYHRAVRKFLLWCQDQGLELQGISPGAVGHYLDQLKVTTSDGQQHVAAISTKKLALAALAALLRRVGDAARGDPQPGSLSPGRTLPGGGGQNSGDHRAPGPKALGLD